MVLTTAVAISKNNMKYEFNEEMLISLGVTFAQFLVSLVMTYILAGKSPRTTFFTILWLSYDLMTHVTLEGPFTYISITGTIENSTHWLSYVWKEYGKADTRWLVSDPTIVSLEILTSVLDSILCLLLIYAILSNRPWRHFIQITLCVCELYGGWMTFAPEWLMGSPNLRTANPIHLWVYLVFFNGIWVVIPLVLLYQSWCDMQGVEVLDYGYTSPVKALSPQQRQQRYNLRKRN